MTILEVVPMTLTEAKAYITEHHRHHKAPVGGLFAIGAAIDFEDAVRREWSAATANVPDLWDISNLARGQCAVTALAVQDEYGGDLVRVTVNGESHYYNRLSDGSELDLTSSQFPDDAEWTAPEIRPRSYLLDNADTARRYYLLREAIRRIVGVVVVGRPVARLADNGWTVEVTRLASDGTPNVPSMLYRAAWRAARAMGYRKLITYTLQTEPGTSLRAAGFSLVGEVTKRSWNTPSRPRVDKDVRQARFRWEVAA